MIFRMVYKSGQIFLPFCHNPRLWQTDGRTDGRTDRILIARPRLHSMQRGKNITKWNFRTCFSTTRIFSCPFWIVVSETVDDSTLAHTRSSLQMTNRSFRYAAPCLWNELPTNLREPRQTQSPALSPITHGSSSSSPSSLSPLASSLTRSVFHFEHKTWLFSRGVRRISFQGG